MEVGGLFFHNGFFEWDGLEKVKTLKAHKATLLKWKEDLAKGANADADQRASQLHMHAYYKDQI